VSGRAPDPIPLHQLDALGPVDQVQVVQQALGVGGDAHLPLGQRAPVDGEVAPLAAAVGGDLLVGQDRPQAGAPVDGGLVQVHQPVVVHHLPPVLGRPHGPRPAVVVHHLAGAVVELGHQLVDRPRPTQLGVVPGVEQPQEDPLRPPVERRVGGGHAAALVVAQPQRPELAAHGGDVLLGGGAGVLARLDRVLLSRQAERVVAHGVQHVATAHPLEAGEDVGPDVAQGVAHVESRSAWVGEHVQHVELGPAHHPVEAVRQRARGVGGVVRPVLGPARLPARLDLVGQRGPVALLRGVGGGLGGHRAMVPMAPSSPLGRSRVTRWVPTGSECT
jgi:hypothetical protein